MGIVLKNNKLISNIVVKYPDIDPYIIQKKYVGNRNVFDNYINKSYLLAYYNAVGRTNQDFDRDVFKDLSGNGFDLRLNNFVYGGMSGWNGYLQNFNDGGKWVAGGNVANKTDNSFTITAATSVMGALIYILSTNINVGDVINMNFEASGIPDGVNLYFGYASTTALRFPIQNGINNMSFTVPLTGNIGFRSEQIFSGANIVIKQIPEYPNAIVTDGIDDYLQSIAALPAFTNNKYTIVFDIERIKATPLGGIFYNAGGVYLYEVSDGNVRWYNMTTSGYLDLPFKDIIAVTSDRAFYKNGKSIASPYIGTALSSALLLGRNETATAYSANAYKSLSIWNGVNYSYEACLNILNRMKNNTLI